MFHHLELTSKILGQLLPSNSNKGEHKTCRKELKHLLEMTTAGKFQRRSFPLPIYYSEQNSKED